MARRLKSPAKRCVLDLTWREAGAIMVAMENMWTGDGSQLSDPDWQALTRIEKAMTGNISWSAFLLGKEE